MFRSVRLPTGTMEPRLPAFISPDRVLCSRRQTKKAKLLRKMMLLLVHVFFFPCGETCGHFDLVI